ncbi:hypothetical protein BOTBODRAFT_36183 [Botryobasidium botryosum FD-172 SS1]|uniref:Uncharacterized protein n=1 Tax=Botryobasidium botryosum (strain FD-172 SS1) TaxID=930990 RepID=A0A067M6Z4_BOTB1|nr:hypothetical protein BOTBODRAFT_36183 [Botryobasidium botryosum FD-172 SS1]
MATLCAKCPSIATLLELLTLDSTPALGPFKKALETLQLSDAADLTEAHKNWKVVDSRFNRLLKLGLWGAEDEQMGAFEQVEREVYAILDEGNLVSASEPRRDSGPLDVETAALAVKSSPAKTDAAQVLELLKVELTDIHAVSAESPSTENDRSGADNHPESQSEESVKKGGSAIFKAGKMFGMGLLAVPMGAVVIAGGAVVVAASAVAGVTLGVGKGAMYVAEGITGNLLGENSEGSTSNKSESQ